MYARLIEFSGAEESKREQILQTVQETVIPMLRTYDGFAGYIALYDPERSRSRSSSSGRREEAAVTRARTRLRIAGASCRAGSASRSSRRTCTRRLSSSPKKHASS